jgi:hypothetical protein
MSTAVVIQTCDRYREYWDGLFHFMGRNWDPAIGAKVYLCNETLDADLPGWCRQIKVGHGSFVRNLKRAIESLDEEDVFLMLEDFWPILPMSRVLFESIHDEFKCGEWDALQVSSYTPYYSLKKSERAVLESNLLEFEPQSQWLFNLQARFWRPEKLLQCLVEPDISESAVSSAITVETASDEFARENLKLKAALYHYIWYPFSGVAYRGQITDFGLYLQNIMKVDRHVSELFSSQLSSKDHQECSA